MNCMKMLPRSMSPDRECFEKVGFRFEDIGDTIMFKAELPKGWNMKEKDNYHTSIYDEKGRERASFYYKGVLNEQTGHMVLYRRYCVKTLSFDNAHFEDAARVAVYDRSSDGYIKDYGSFPNSFCDEFDHAQDDAYAWLKKHFPKCEDPTAYWDE